MPSVGGGAALLTGGSLVFLASGYVVAVLLARLLGPAEYGRVSVAVAAMTILNTINSTGLPQALSRFVAANPSQAESALGTATELQVRATVLSAIALLGGAAALAVAGDELAPYLAVASLTVVPHGLLTLGMSYDNGRHAFRRQAGVLALYSIVKAIVVVGLAIVGRGLGAVAGYGVSSLAVLGASRHRIGRRDPAHRRTLVAFAAPIVAFVGLSATQLNLDLFLVQLFGGAPDEVGWYAAAQQVARAVYFTLSGLALAIMPIVATREADADRAALVHTVRQATRWSLLLVAPVVAIVSVAAEPTIVLLYSDSYAAAAAPLPALMPGMAALTVFAALAAVLTGLGRPWLSVAIAGAALATTLVACAALVPARGLVGAAVGTSVGAGVALAGVLLVLARMLGPVVEALTVLRIGIGAVVAGAVVVAVEPRGAALVVVSAAATAAYGLVLVLLRELDGEDVRRVRAIVGRPAG